MDAFLLQILNGLDKGSAYALIALGLTLIFGTLFKIARDALAQFVNVLELGLHLVDALRELVVKFR